MKNINFPFSAIVGQAQLKTALLLCAVDPTLGGVLIRGDKGTAKSTAARALADILPPVERVVGCAFNCLPDAANEHCEICSESTAVHQTSTVPFITLPLGATEDRVVGTLDLERALKGAKRAFQPGLLAAAHRGILYVDEVNLLQDHLVDVLLDAAAMGVNAVQREGLSVTHAARFTLIGTMNLEEGDLRPQLLDRFGLMVEVTAPRDKTLRADVVRRRIAFEADPEGYAAAWVEQQNHLRRQLIAAQQILPQVVLDDALLELISHLCCEFDVASLRADIVMYKAARALAALDARMFVTPEDVRGAAELVLPHRRRRLPFEQAGLDQERLDDVMQQAGLPQNENLAQNENQAQNENPDPSNAADEDEPDNATAAAQLQQTQQQSEQQVFEAASTGTVRHIAVDSKDGATGKRSKMLNASRGHVIRAVPHENPSSLAVSATLRSAALRNPAEFTVTKRDLHQQIRVGKGANLIVFVVDASASMAAQRRMEAVKGAVLSLLTDAYQRRDEVAVISFGGASAAVLLAPTRSVDLAEKGLRELPTGGRTPLPHALQLALEMLGKNNGVKRLPPLLIIISDGKANVALNDGGELGDCGDPWRETLALAAELAERAIAALVIDTETGYLRLGRAAQLAQALGAECLTMEELSAENLTLTIRGCLSAT